MDFSPTDMPADQSQPSKLPPLPQLWIGYLLGVATVVAEYVALSLHPELAKAEFAIPPLYLFLAVFVGTVYWLVCIHRFHVILQCVPGWKHPISPARAVGFHFIPIYYLYWIFKWPKEISKYVNWRFHLPVMKPYLAGSIILAGFVLGLFFDPGFGLIVFFMAISYISACLRRAFALPPMPSSGAPPSAE
jgi:hypothetical protein